MRVLEEYADVLGQASIDEAYLDSTKDMALLRYSMITFARLLQFI